jgi:CBS domain-containing protein
MQIVDLMTPDIEVVTTDYTVGMAAQMMADLDCELLPVIEGNHLIGAITGREIATRVVAEGLDPKQITVGQAMTSDILYCFETEPVSDVSQKMTDWWVRCLPVVDQEKRLIGTVSLADLLELSAAPKTKEVGMPSHHPRTSRSARQTRGARRRAAAA